MQVDAGRRRHPRVEGRRVAVDPADEHGHLGATGRDDPGLDVDGHEDPLVADEVGVPRLPGREVDVGAGERGEAVGVDRLAELVTAELEGGHQTPPSLKVVTWSA